jgi:carbon monoxide dehydrogenase subunit G
MEFDNTFSVASPIDDVWSAVLDVERVAPCVPGARVIERTGEDAYKVAIKVKLGPVSMTYTGNVEITEVAEDERRAVMRARARESRGQGTADATVEMRLAGNGAGETTGAIHTDVAISGRAAAMGQGVIADVSARLIDTFAANLATMLAGGPAEPDGSTAAADEPAATPAPSPSPPPTTPPTSPPPPSPVADDGLSVLPILGGVVAGRLRDPRVLACTLAAAALVGFVLGRRSAG